MSGVGATQVKALREATGAGMMDCKRALQEAGGDLDRAIEILREQGLASAKKRAGRAANQGAVESYIHFNNSVGVLVEVNCETDFVAKTDEFRSLARDIAIHIASMQPRWAAREDIPEEVIASERRIYETQVPEGKPENVIERIIEGKFEAFYKDSVLVDQPFVKDESKSVGELIDEVSAKVGEKVAARRFVRYKLGEETE